MNNQDVAKMVFDRIGGLLDGDLKWDNGRTDYFFPMNPVSRSVYHGSNAFSLGLLSSFIGYKKPHFMTFNQARGKGGHIIKGEKAFPVVFWKMLKFEREGKSDKLVPMMRYYQVFNLDQIEGLPEDFYTVKESDAQILQAPEVMVKEYIARESLDVVETFGPPYYSPGKDNIGMPPITSFTTATKYYESYFHEMVHSTAAMTRLNRELDPHHTQGYSKEELIAEYGAAILAAKTGSIDGYQNLAAYIKHWYGKIGDNPVDLVSAAGKASRAVDYITGEANEHEEAA